MQAQLVALGMVLCALVAAGTAATPASAQPAPPNAPREAPPAVDTDRKGEAAKLIAAGDRFIERGRGLERRGKADRAKAEFERALAAYRRAYQLVANPKIYFAIATAEEALERWVEAARHYQTVLADVDDTAANRALRDAATARLEETKQHLGVLTLRVKPAGASITLDGEPVELGPSGVLLLAPGAYTLAFTADRFTPLEVKVNVEAGSESERSFALDPTPVLVAAPKPAARHAPLPRPNTLLLWTGLGATTALAIATTTTGLLAISRHGDFTDSDATQLERNQARRSGRRLAHATDVLLGTTITVGVITGLYYFKVYRPTADERSRRLDERAGESDELGVEVLPYLGGDGAGLAVLGTF